MRPELPVKASVLAMVMSGISERCWCAGWMGGLEYSLWKAVLEGPQKYGAGQITERDIEALRWLSSEADGWVVYITDEKLPYSEWGTKFVSFAEWEESFNKIHNKVEE